MPKDEGTGETLTELEKKLEQGLALGRGTGVMGAPRIVESSFVANAYGVEVVATTVGTGLRERTAGVAMAITRDIIVVTNVAETAAEVVATELGEGVGLRGASGRAVEDDECDGSHSFVFG